MAVVLEVGCAKQLRLTAFVAPGRTDKFDPGQIRPAANGRHAAAPGPGEASSSRATYPPWRSCPTAEGHAALASKPVPGHRSPARPHRRFSPLQRGELVGVV